MITFPSRTKLPKPQVIPKKNLLQNLEMSTAEKQDLTEQVQKIQITHVMDTKSTNIPAGHRVSQLAVMQIDLKGKVINKDLLKAIDERMSMYIVFLIISSDSDQSLLINYKEELSTVKNGKRFAIIRSFESAEAEEIELKGNTLDEVYENLVRAAAPDEITITSTGDMGASIKKAEEIEQLTKKAELLKKKMFSEKSMRKQMEYRKAWKEVLSEIEVLRR